MRIPDGISIAGCDNTDVGATQTPGLTNIRTPGIGRAAAQQVIARPEGEPFTPFAVLDFGLVAGGSRRAGAGLIGRLRARLILP